MPKKVKSLITDAKKKKVEEEVKLKQSEVKYDLRDFTVAFLVQEFNNDLFYIPHYQREFVWRNPNKCRFIESVLLGLPIPMMFVAEMSNGLLEIVDGAQRIQTLEQFKSNELKLSGLNELKSLNGFRYNDLPSFLQRKFNNKPLRIVVLEESTSVETRQEIFHRVNTSGVKASGSEIRRGSYQGRFMKFITKCSKEELLKKLCPVGVALEKRYEYEELVLRFFAYSDCYKSFRHDVDLFLTNYLRTHLDEFDSRLKKKEFTRMLKFVEKYFPYGFAKNPNANSTPRVRFEAISVGVNLALRENPRIKPGNIKAWLESDRFLEETTTHASNSRPRLIRRVEFVRDSLLSSGSVEDF